MPGKDESVQLITSIQACHWFDLPAFFKEARRVLCWNGALVLVGYTFPQFIDSSQHMQKALELVSIQSTRMFVMRKCSVNQLILLKVYNQTGPYWGKGRQSVDLEYADINIPWNDFRR